MTTRLYYTDQSLQAFDASVLSCEAIEGRFHVVLDRSAFYPTSGGQPHDVGRLGDADVVDVIETDAGDVVHVLDRAIRPGERVTGWIEWARRFDHMQQHTGQHVLSAACDRGLGVQTLSFHMGAAVSTIDLAREVTPAECVQVEAEANRIVWEDRPVQVRFATAEEAAALPLRKETARIGTLRLVEVSDFDLSACGGTHVARTGTIGLIAIVATERFKGATRVTFVCGGRALTSHRRLRDVVHNATRALAVPVDDVVVAIERSLTELRETGRQLRKLQQDVARYRAAEIRSGAETMGPYRVVLTVEPEMDGLALKGLASSVVSESGTIVVGAGKGSPVPVVVACGAGVAVSAAALLKEVVAALGGRGGGTASMAQGGVTAEASVFLGEAKHRLQAMVSAPEPSGPIG